MATRDTSEIKNSILKFLDQKGPSLPIHIAKEIQMEMMFAAAFLSELLSEQKIKSTHLRVGSSPVYYLKNQEEQLEKFSEYLKFKEKEAYAKLKKDRFLEDEKQEPAIRIALRSIKDFAKPFEKQENIFWRYYLEEASNFKKSSPTKSSLMDGQKIQDYARNDEGEIKPKEKSKKPTIKKKTSSKTPSEKKNERFFNTIKEHLVKKGIEIEDILGFTKGDLVLKIKQNGSEKILIAYNKKRVTETDILNAYKKAKESGLNYKIIALGEPAKKTTNTINAMKKLDSIELIE